jgi:ADP-L-glycero-D-manno-heptose 6-epimerase
VPPLAEQRSVQQHRVHTEYDPPMPDEIPVVTAVRHKPSSDRPFYIVTGGAGFIGSNLVAALLARSPQPYVLVVDNFRTGSFANIVEACDRRGVGPFDGEISVGSKAYDDWEWIGARFSPLAVFHLAAITDTTLSDESEMIRENTGGFGGMLHGCASFKIPLVYASSAATYGTPPQTRDRVPFPLEAAGRPNNVYGFSKWLMECAHRRFVDAEVLADSTPHIVGLRYFNVFGPGETRKGKMASMPYQLARQMLAGGRPRVFVDGSQARDQVYVDDVVDCTLAAAGLGAKKEVRPGIYNLGSGVATSFNDIIAALRGALGLGERERPTDYFHMPDDIRAFYQDYTCADMTETERALGWKPKWKPADAIAEYARYLKR